MKEEQIVQQLSSENAALQNAALNTITQKMKYPVISKTNIPVSVDSNEVWNLALIALWKHICLSKKKFDCSNQNAIERFLYTVCKRMVIRNINKNKKYVLDNNVFLPLADSTDLEKTLIEMEIVEEVKSLFSRHISETAQEILIYKYYLGMSYQDISERMNKSCDSLKTTKCRAMNKLKKAVRQNPALKTYLWLLLGKTDGMPRA